MDRLPDFDNLDHRIRYVHLWMERDLEGISHVDLPEGFRFVFYKDGDRDAWIEIEKSAGEFSKYEEGLEAWKKYYEICEQDLPGRMLFIENKDGVKVATATAYDGRVEGKEPGTGILHWVSVRKEAQGKGLARPLICKALETLKELGDERVQLSTQTTTWVACKLYLDFGFRPIPENIREEAVGWRILKRLTGHPALEEFPEAAEEELLNSPA